MWLPLHFYGTAFLYGIALKALLAPGTPENSWCTCCLLNTCIHRDTHTQTQTQTHTYTDTETHTRIHRHKHTHTQTQTQTHAYTDTETRTRRMLSLKPLVPWCQVLLQSKLSFKLHLKAGQVTAGMYGELMTCQALHHVLSPDSLKPSQRLHEERGHRFSIYSRTKRSDLVLSDWASLVAQLVKNPPAMQETLVRFLGREDPLEKG